MAYTFVSGDLDRMNLGSAPVTTYPFTMAAWAKGANATANHTVMHLGQTGANNMHYISLEGAAAGDPVRAISMVGGTYQVAETTTGFTSGTWCHACGVFTNSTSRTAYINGGDSATNTGSSSPTGINDLYLNRYNDSGGSLYGSQDIAEAAIWDVALTADEVLSLARGFSPLLVRPWSLVFYAPLIRDLVNMKGTALTNTGAVVADHPRILMPQPPRIHFIGGAAAGPVIPVFMARARQMVA